MTQTPYHQAADIIKSKLDGACPKIALTLGSGLNALADDLEAPQSIPYGEIAGFPEPTVAGHEGRIVVGRLNGVAILCLQGRAHLYEGHPAPLTIFATRTLWALGVETLILTNAAGSLNQAAGPGSLMAITDHINLSGFNPLIGANDERIGPRFPDMTNAWDPVLRATLHKAADEIGVPLHDGVYLMVSGPNFETPAEIRAFRTMGADAVGMSTVPECLAARHAGLRVVGISSITNLAAGMTGEELTHHETMAYGAKAGKTLEKLLAAFLPKIAS